MFWKYKIQSRILYELLAILFFSRLELIIFVMKLITHFFFYYLKSTKFQFWFTNLWKLKLITSYAAAYERVQITAHGKIQLMCGDLYTIRQRRTFALLRRRVVWNWITRQQCCTLEKYMIDRSEAWVACTYYMKKKKFCELYEAGAGAKR